MAGLVALAGALALFSGVLGAFGRGKVTGALSLVPLLEVLAGIGGPAFVLTQRPSPGMDGIVLALLLILVLASSTLRVLKGREARRHRELTESARLAAHIRFQAMLDDSEEKE